MGELADITARPLPIISERSWRCGEAAGEWQKAVLKKGRKGVQGSTCEGLVCTPWPPWPRSSLPWGLPHTLPVGPEAHFSSACGLQCLPELCGRRAGLQLSHRHAHARLRAPSIPARTGRLTSRLDFGPASSPQTHLMLCTLGRCWHDAWLCPARLAGALRWDGAWLARPLPCREVLLPSAPSSPSPGDGRPWLRPNATHQSGSPR